jgi:membrane protein required for colicin V production
LFNKIKYETGIFQFLCQLKLWVADYRFLFNFAKQMNALDLYIAIPILLGFVIGLFRGLIKEIISLTIIIVGILLSRLLAPSISDKLVDWFSISPQAAQPLSFIIAFLIIALVLIIIGRLLHKMIKMLSLGLINSILGGIVSAIKYIIIISVILVLMEALDNKFSLLSKDLKEESTLYKPIKKIAPDLWKEFKKDTQ